MMSPILNPLSGHQIFLARVTFSEILLVTNFIFLKKNMFWSCIFLLNIFKAQEKESNMVLKQKQLFVKILLMQRNSKNSEK